MLQPEQQFLPVMRTEDGAEFRIGRFAVGKSDMVRQQVQIVISKCDHQAVTQAVEQPQYFQRLTPAVNEITAAPQPIRGRVEIYFFQQAL
jgi:hypothetical protein